MAIKGKAKSRVTVQKSNGTATSANGNSSSKKGIGHLPVQKTYTSEC